MSSPRRLAVLCVAALAAGGVRAAGPSLAVVTLDAPPSLAFSGKSAAEAFAKEAAKGGQKVLGPAAVEAKLGPAAHEALVRCGDDAACLSAKGRALGVDRVVAGRLTQHGTSYRVSLVHADARSGARLGAVEREIPVASRRLQRDVAATAPLLLKSQEDAGGVLKVVTEVAGAEVTLDDQPAGTTPMVRTVSPGKHKVKVSRVGFADAEPVWVDVPAHGVVEHRPRLYRIPARDRPNPSGREGSGTAVQLVK